MKCCVCKTEVDTSTHTVPPTWFKRAKGDVTDKVICAECACKAENKEWWQDE